MSEYNYRLEVFEGPLDLLLHLIDKHKIDIYDIPIAQVTEQYMTYLENWTSFDFVYSSEFLVMAAKLLQIKSQLLLPSLESEEKEEDPRDELVDRLVEYKHIKELSQKLQVELEAQSAFFVREEGLSQCGLDTVYRLDSSALYKAFQQACRTIGSRNEEMNMLKVSREIFTVEDKMNTLRDELLRNNELALINFLLQSASREEVIVSFLAVLELVKNQIIFLEETSEGIINLYLVRKE